ncbi:WXG100 family type VII secretion target [Streptomyces bluensis]|uniref:WXG100 family type VII secretion target n=1 Tax=Streptomyces bluensis TaxID=33897 RepID=UPI003319D31C
MSSDFDDIRPISAPNTGPDPRISAPTAPNTGPDPRTGYQMPDPPTQADVRDFDPAPGATTGGGHDSGDIQFMSAGGGSGGVQTNGMSGVRDPAALNRAGQASTEMASVVQSHGHVGSDDRMWGGVGALSGDLWGGQLGAELSKTMESWDKQATKLKKLCQEIGTRCTTTAGNYTRTESANEQEMNAVRSSLSDFN